MSPLKVQCRVEETKSDKWRRLAPTGEKSPIGPIPIRAEAVAGVSGTITVVIPVR